MTSGFRALVSALILSTRNVNSLALGCGSTFFGWLGPIIDARFVRVELHLHIALDLGGRRQENLPYLRKQRQETTSSTSVITLVSKAEEKITFSPTPMQRSIELKEESPLDSKKTCQKGKLLAFLTLQNFARVAGLAWVSRLHPPGDPYSLWQALA